MRSSLNALSVWFGDNIFNLLSSNPGDPLLLGLSAGLIISSGHASRTAVLGTGINLLYSTLGLFGGLPRVKQLTLNRILFHGQMVRLACREISNR